MVMMDILIWGCWCWYYISTSILYCGCPDASTTSGSALPNSPKVIAITMSGYLMMISKNIHLIMINNDPNIWRQTVSLWNFDRVAFNLNNIREPFSLTFNHKLHKSIINPQWNHKSNDQVIWPCNVRPSRVFLLMSSFWQYGNWNVSPGNLEMFLKCQTLNVEFLVHLRLRLKKYNRKNLTCVEFFPHKSPPTLWERFFEEKFKKEQNCISSDRSHEKWQ